MTDTSKPSSPILILGAGLAGPALCLSLRSYGFPCRLLERRPSPDTKETSSNSDGGSITIAANSIRAILQCAAGADLLRSGDGPFDLLAPGSASAELHDKLRAVGFSYDSMTLQDDTGYKYGRVTVGEGAQGGMMALRIMRGDLRRIILEECAMRGVEVEWGVRVKDVTENESGVELGLEDGSFIKGEFPADPSSLLNLPIPYVYLPLPAPASSVYPGLGAGDKKLMYRLFADRRRRHPLSRPGTRTRISLPTTRHTRMEQLNHRERLSPALFRSTFLLSGRHHIRFVPQCHLLSRRLPHGDPNHPRRRQTRMGHQERQSARTVQG